MAAASKRGSEPSSPTKTITLIRHHDNEAEMSDNVVLFCKRRNIDVRFCSPHAGDELNAAGGVTPTVIFGGGQNVTELDKFSYLQDELRWIDACLEQEIPILGICLGAQLMAHALGGNVSAREPVECEFGFYRVTPTAAAKQRHWLPEPQFFMQAHFQEFQLPPGAERLAGSENFPEQAFRYGECAYAVQFHPEVNQAILNDWHADTWSGQMAATRGAQTYREQQRLGREHLSVQASWLDNFLADLFLFGS